MTPGKHDKLDTEQVLGRQAQTAYEGFIKPFIIQKTTELHAAFVDCPMDDTNFVMEIKRTLSVLERLDVEVQSVITTGKMASQQLLKEPHSKH